MSKEYDESEASDAVPDLPRRDNDENEDEDDPRQQFSRLETERILQLTDVSFASSSMLASGSTLPSINNNDDDDEKAKAKAAVSNLDGSVNVRKLDPPLRRPESEPVKEEEQQQAIPSTNGAGVSLSAAQVLALSGKSEHTNSSSTQKTSRGPAGKPKKRNAGAVGNGNSKQAPPVAATVPGAVATNTNDTVNEKQMLSSAAPQSNNDHVGGAAVVAANEVVEEPGSSAFMSTPGAYSVEGVGGTTARSNGVPEPPPSPTSQQQKKEQSLVMASAIDKEALKEELRQELLAEQTAQVVMAVPTGTDDDDENAPDSVNMSTGRAQRSSSQLSFANNRKWWILLAVAALVVGGAVAISLIVTPSSSSGSSDGGGKKKNNGGGGGGN